MTRAIDRLIVSGSIDSQRKADEKTPIGWVLGRLDCAAELPSALEAPIELEREGARVLVRVDRTPPAAEPVRVVEPVEAVVDDETGQLALFSPGAAPPLPPLAPVLAPIQALPEPPLHDVRRLSYSALALFERCSYRYYAERVAGMRPADAHGTVAGQSGLAATEVGDAVHRLLELVDLTAPDAAGRRAGACLVSGRDRGGAGADRRLRRVVLRFRPRDGGSRRSRERGRSGRSRSSTTASSCTDGWTSSIATGRGRSSSTTRRTRSPRARRRRSSRPTTGCSGSSTRSRASAPGQRRWRSSTTSSSGPTPSSRPPSRARTRRRSKRSSRRRSAGSGPASSCRRRASSSAPAALPSTSSVPGTRLRSRPPELRSRVS